MVRKAEAGIGLHPSTGVNIHADIEIILENKETDADTIRAALLELGDMILFEIADSEVTDEDLLLGFDISEEK